jgi:hypothetical protein
VDDFDGLGPLRMVNFGLRGLSIVINGKDSRNQEREKNLSNGVQKLNQGLRKREFETESMSMLERLC